jgi:colicin import membrane protein
MRETRADTALSVLLAIGLHIVLLALMFAGLWWTRAETVSAAGQPVEAELIDPNALSASMQRALRTPAKPLPPPEPAEETAPPPQPVPEPSPQDSPVPPQRQAQERVPEPDAIEQERVDRDAISAETREREQEEKRRQEQIDLTEQRERQEEAQEQRRLAALAAIRKQKEEVSKQINRAEQKLQQIADARARNAAEAASLADAVASASPPPGNNGTDASLLAKYQAAIQAAIQSQWVKPDNVPEGAICRLTIRQLPGGEVAAGGVSFGSPCQFDDVARDSVERAVLKAAPLPYAGFEKVFNRTLLLNFEAQSR